LTFQQPLQIATDTQQQQQVALTNNGGWPLALNGLVLSDTTDYTVTNNTAQGGDGCTTLAANGGTCYIYVAFNPQSTRVYPNNTSKATLKLEAGPAPAKSLTLHLSGTVAQPTYELTGTVGGQPLTSLSFGEIVVLQPSTLPVLVTNTSPSANVTISGISTTSAVFTAQSDPSSGGCVETAIAPGNYCTINVTFTPLKADTVTGKLKLTVAAPGAASGSSTELELTGTGTK
jgi:hypothetical protein